MEYVLSELSTMTHLFRLALQGTNGSLTFIILLKIHCQALTILSFPKINYWVKLSHLAEGRKNDHNWEQGEVIHIKEKLSLTFTMHIIQMAGLFFFFLIALLRYNLHTIKFTNFKSTIQWFLKSEWNFNI